MVTRYTYEWFGRRFTAPDGQDTEQLIALAENSPDGMWVTLLDWAHEPAAVFVRSGITFRRVT